MSKTYVGIDIGKDGAIALIRPNGKIETHHMPKIKTEIDLPSLVQIIIPSTSIDEPSNDVHIVFEKLGVIFGSGKSTAFSMGYQSGAVEMACVCQNISYTKVRAVEWQKAMLTGVDEISKTNQFVKLDEEGDETVVSKKIRDTKAMALVAIKRIFPTLKLTFGERATKPHDGLIDAVLMAEYARRNNL